MAYVLPLGPAHLFVACTYACASVASVVLYGLDKAAARRGGRRVPEVVLHIVALAGGWPGALLGQAAFRHKTVKRSFRIAFWGTVVLNSLVLVWVLDRLAGSPVW